MPIWTYPEWVQTGVQNNFWFERQPNWQHMMELLSERLANMSPHWAAVSCISHSQLMYPHSTFPSFQLFYPPPPGDPTSGASKLWLLYLKGHIGHLMLLLSGSCIFLLKLIFYPFQIYLPFCPPSTYAWKRTYNLFGLHSCTFWPPRYEYIIHTWLGGWNLWHQPVLHIFLSKKIR